MSLKSKRKSGYIPFFVYGTLLPGQPNYYLWGKEIISKQPAMLMDGRLYNMGYYPMLVEVEGEVVHGRLITVRRENYERVIEMIDSLEGFDPDKPRDSAYRRVERKVMLDDGRSVDAWIYLGQMKYVGSVEPIESGDWLSYITDLGEIEMWWREIDTVYGLHEAKE